MSTTPGSPPVKRPKRRSTGYLNQAQLLVPSRHDPEVARLLTPIAGVTGHQPPPAPARRTGWLAHQLLGHHVITGFGQT